jgi:serine/threonine protein kinase
LLVPIDEGRSSIDHSTSRVLPVNVCLSILDGIPKYLANENADGGNRSGLLLGTGSEGCVVRGVLHGNICATKYITIRNDENIASLTRELNTAEKLAQFPSNFLVSVHHVSFHSDGNSPDFVKLHMSVERCSSQEFFESAVLKEQAWGPFMQNVVIPVFVHDVLRGLHHLHDRVGRCHNDLKLSNVLLSANGSGFKLTDFGCSVALPPSASPMRRAGSSDSVRDVLCRGAVGTRPPERDVAMIEHADGKVYGTMPVCSTKTDMWSLGEMLVTLFQYSQPRVDRSVITKKCNDIKFAPRRRVARKIKALLDTFPCGHPLRSVVSMCLSPESSKRPTALSCLEGEWLRGIECNLDSLRQQLQGFTTALHTELGLLEQLAPTRYLRSIFRLEDEDTGLGAAPSRDSPPGATPTFSLPSSPPRCVSGHRLIAAVSNGKKILRFRRTLEMRTAVPTAVSASQYRKLHGPLGMMKKVPHAQ